MNEIKDSGEKRCVIWWEFDLLNFVNNFSRAIKNSENSSCFENDLAALLSANSKMIF